MLSNLNTEQIRILALSVRHSIQLGAMPKMPVGTSIEWWLDELASIAEELEEELRPAIIDVSIPIIRETISCEHCGLSYIDCEAMYENGTPEHESWFEYDANHSFCKTCKEDICEGRDCGHNTWGA